MDKAHEWTDVRLAKIERELKKIYRRSFEEIDKKTKDYFSQFAEEDKIKRALFESGKIDRAEYDRWRRTKTLQGQHWERMRDAIVQEHLKVRRTALAYINGQLPEIYAKNYNVFVNMYSSLVAGGGYEQVSASTVKNLALSNKSLLPYKQVNTRKYERWCTKKVNAELLQGVLQGDPISDIADRLQRVTVMDRTAAIRNARTTVTSAENKGRLDSLKTAEENGLILSKRWLSVDDNRTRHEHHLLNGQETGLDEPFTVNGMDIMYPGDPNAEASLVYNCRCTLTSEVKGFKKIETENELVDINDFPSIINDVIDQFPEDGIITPEMGWLCITDDQVSNKTQEKTYIEPKFNLKIRVNVPNAKRNGFASKVHYHIHNPYKTSKLDEYIDANGKPTPHGSKKSHILPKRRKQ